MFTFESKTMRGFTETQTHAPIYVHLLQITHCHLKHTMAHMVT